MKKLLTLLFIIPTLSFSQTDKLKVAKQKFAPASFPGGKSGLDTYLISNSWQYDTVKCKPTLCKALVHFDKSGKVKLIQMDTTSCRGCSFGFYQMLISMPSWNPAIDEQGNPAEDKQEITFTYKYLYRVKMKPAKNQ